MRYIKKGGSLVEVPMRRGEIVKVEASVPPILVPEEDCVTFEWWDSDFTAQDCQAIFDVYTTDRIGPDKLKKR